MEFKYFVLFLAVSIHFIFSSPLFTSMECRLYLDIAFMCNPFNRVTTSTSKLWKFSYKEVLFMSYQRVSRRHGLSYSPKVQSICIITYNLFTRLVGIVPNECLACFMMAVKDDRRSTNNIVFEQLVDVLILVVKEMEFSLGSVTESNQTLMAIPGREMA